jgi:heme/copper-type cytochrome/quinol oxidase subunit 4
MDDSNVSAQDTAPGEDGSETPGVTNYLIGFGLAIVLTGASFWAAGTTIFSLSPSVFSS